MWEKKRKKKKEKRRKRNDLHMFVKFAPLIIMQFESLFPYSPSFFFFPIFPFFFLFLFFFFSFSHTPYSMINEQVQSIASHHAKPMTMELSIWLRNLISRLCFVESLSISSVASYRRTVVIAWSMSILSCQWPIMHGYLLPWPVE